MTARYIYIYEIAAVKMLETDGFNQQGSCRWHMYMFSEARSCQYRHENACMQEPEYLSILR